MVLRARHGGFQWMTDRERQGRWSPSVLLLKILESSCWVLLWINAIWLVASAIHPVSYSKEKRLKTHRRRCNKPTSRQAYTQHRTEDKCHMCPQWTIWFKHHRITHTVWSDQKTEKATDLCIKMHHKAPKQVNAMAWKPNLPAFDCFDEHLCD